MSDIDDLIRRAHHLRQKAVRLRSGVLGISPVEAQDELDHLDTKVVALDALKAHQRAAAFILRDAWQAKAVRLRKHAASSSKAVPAHHLADDLIQNRQLS